MFSLLPLQKRLLGVPGPIWGTQKLSSFTLFWPPFSETICSPYPFSAGSLLCPCGRPECPYIYGICKISEVLKFFWWLCFSEKITVPSCIRVFSRMPSCIRSSHSYTNTICEHGNPQNSVFSMCLPLLAKNREKGRRQVRESEIRPFRAQKQNRVGSPCQEGFSKVVSPHSFRVAERTRPNKKIARGLPVGKGL
jgi:hypothetical protein